jgi:hypothetical protein
MTDHLEYVLTLLTLLQWTRVEVELYLMKMRQGLRNPKVHAYQE